MKSVKSIIVAALVAAVAAAGTAEARTRLLAASPPAGASVAPPAWIILHFDQPLELGFSGGKLTSSTKVEPMVAHGDPSDARTLVLVPAQPLKPGVYKVTWHVVGVDTHGVEGDYVFSVR